MTEFSPDPTPNTLNKGSERATKVILIDGTPLAYKNFLRTILHRTPSPVD